jgi:hypothetical protein
LSALRSNSLQKKVFREMGKKHFNTEQDAIAGQVFVQPADDII